MSMRNIFATVIALAFSLTARCADFALDLSQSGQLPASAELLASQPIAVGDTIAVSLPSGSRGTYCCLSRLAVSRYLSTC